MPDWIGPLSYAKEPLFCSNPMLLFQQFQWELLKRNTVTFGGQLNLHRPVTIRMRNLTAFAPCALPTDDTFRFAEQFQGFVIIKHPLFRSRPMNTSMSNHSAATRRCDLNRKKCVKLSRNAKGILKHCLVKRH